MGNLNKVIRRENKRNKRNVSAWTRTTIRIDYEDKKAILKKSGTSFQKTIQKLVKEYLAD